MSDYSFTVRFLAANARDAWLFSRAVRAKLEAAVPDETKRERCVAITPVAKMMFTRYEALRLASVSREGAQEIQSPPAPEETSG